MEKYISLDLEKYFNHKAIFTDDNSEINLENAGLPTVGIGGVGISVLGRGFLSSACPASGEIICVDNIPFIFPEKNDSKYDIVACTGINISVPVCKYSKIHILGFATWQNYSDYIKLLFENNNYEEICFSFLDWYNCKNSDFYEMGFDRQMLLQKYKIAYIAECTRGSEVGFTYTYSPIKSIDNILTGLELPYNPNMYITAVTLEK